MVTLRADEIINIIHERIEQYNREVKVVNTGTVLQVGRFLSGRKSPYNILVLYRF